MTSAAPATGAPTARVPLTLLALITPVLVLTFVFCRAGRLNWLLEVGPALVGYGVLAATYRRLRLSDFCYVCVFLHTLILVYGGYYTYALTPLGDWAKETFHLSRNHYDRVGHFALGFFPVSIIREVLLRVTPLGAAAGYVHRAQRRAGDSRVLRAHRVVVDVLFASDVGQAFLGPRATSWDAQWDMFLGLVGGAAGLIVLGRVHDRSMERWARFELSRPRDVAVSS